MNDTHTIINCVIEFNDHINKIYEIVLLSSYIVTVNDVIIIEKHYIKNSKVFFINFEFNFEFITNLINSDFATSFVICFITKLITSSVSHFVMRSIKNSKQKHSHQKLHFLREI